MLLLRLQRLQHPRIRRGEDGVRCTLRCKGYTYIPLHVSLVGAALSRRRHLERQCIRTKEAGSHSGDRNELRKEQLAPLANVSNSPYLHAMVIIFTDYAPLRASGEIVHSRAIRLKALSRYVTVEQMHTTHR